MVDDAPNNNIETSSINKPVSGTIKENVNIEIDKLNDDDRIQEIINEINTIKSIAYAMCAKHADVVSDFKLIGNQAEKTLKKLTR